MQHTILFNDEEHNYYLDDVLISNLGTNFTPHYQPIYLFGLNTDGNFAYQSASRIYYCKIWDNGELIRDYIPVIDRDGVACLYDKVNDKLYYNENNGGDSFATNYTAYEVKVDRNLNLTEENLRMVNGTPEDAIISDLVIKNSTGTVIESTLSDYDIYTVTFDMNGEDVTQKFIPVPSTSLTLTNELANASFESELTNYYNGTAYRSSTIKRTGSYSMYFTCSASQAFLRIKYGDIGAKDNDVYVRLYSYIDNSSLSPLLYIYETETTADWPNTANRFNGYFTKADCINRWGMLSKLTNPTTSNYSYFMLQYAQGSTSGTGNVYWDDVMALVLDSNTWDAVPTVAWLDKMIPDFTGTQVISW